MLMNKEPKLPYFQTESFGAVDGPGIRYVVFSQGCYYRCIYCHNPESWDVGKKVNIFSVQDIIDRYEHNITFYKNGGITLSGGDPLIYGEFCELLAKKCYEKNISLALDTSGVNFSKQTEAQYKKICKWNPLWIVDIKQINPKKHKMVTGVIQQREVELVKFLDKNKQKFWIRQVLVPGYTDDPKDLKQLGKFLKGLKGMTHFQIFPYHNLAIPKYENLHIDYPLKNTKLPTDEDISKATEAVKQGFNIKRK